MWTQLRIRYEKRLAKKVDVRIRTVRTVSRSLALVLPDWVDNKRSATERNA